METHGCNVYTVGYCVNSVMADLNETSTNNYQRYLKWGIDGFRRLNLANMVQTTIKTAVIEIDHNTQTGKLPPDYVSFLKVGYSCNGQIINLDFNDDLKFHEELDACGCQEELQQCQYACDNGGWGAAGGYGGYLFYSSVWYYNSYWRNSQYVAGAFGVGAGRYRNAYRINAAKGEIQFDSYIRADFVVMEYLSNGIDCGDAYLDETLVPAVTAYIHWKRATFDQSVSRLEAQNFERQWKQELRGVVARKAALNAWDWKQLWRNSMVQIAKR